MVTSWEMINGTELSTVGLEITAKSLGCFDLEKAASSVRGSTLVFKRKKSHCK